MSTPQMYSGIRLNHHTDGRCDICTSLFCQQRGYPRGADNLTHFCRVKSKSTSGGLSKRPGQRRPLLRRRLCRNPRSNEMAYNQQATPSSHASRFSCFRDTQSDPSSIVASTAVSTTPIVTAVSTQMSSTASASREKPKPPPTVDDIPF